MKKKETIWINEILEFIVKNSENKEWMDRINKVSFPFTTKYEKFSEKTQYIPYRKIENSDRFSF